MGLKKIIQESQQVNILLETYLKNLQLSIKKKVSETVTNTHATNHVFENIENVTKHSIHSDLNDYFRNKPKTTGKCLKFQKNLDNNNFGLEFYFCNNIIS